LKKYKTVLFDLDGTLTDSKEGIVNSIKYSLNKLNYMETEEEKFNKFIGPPLKESFKKFCGFDDEKTESAIKYYREYFTEKGMFENRIYDGILNILKDLKSNNMKIILATSKPMAYAKKILSFVKADSFFTDIIGSNLDGTMSDKSEIIAYILKKHGLKKSETVMVGDRSHDIIGANKNGIDAVGVLYGYGDIEELSSYNPAFIVKTADELKDIILG
jgi:phosphoglycolate phosphatase